MSQAEQNKILVRRLVEIVNAGELDAVGEVASGQIAVEAERWIGAVRQSFPDFHMELVEIIAEEDKVAGYFTCSGTHEGDWLGRPPPADASRTERSPPRSQLSKTTSRG